MDYKPSVYQQAIFEWIEAHEGHNLVVEAVAGSGKTTTGVQALKRVPPSEQVVFLAFNKHIATELQSRVPANTRVSTYHALGFSVVRGAFGNKVKVDAEKLDTLLKQYSPLKYQRALWPACKRLVSLCKSNLLQGDTDDLQELSAYHNIELNGNAPEVFEAVTWLLGKSLSITDVIDFDDMCYMPVVLQLPANKYDFLFVDELQDTNRVQIELALMSISEQGRIVGVGDRFQSIYGFRGADVDAIPNLINRLDADTLPLSITYRNPKSVVALVNQKFPEIRFEGAEWAKEGIVETKVYETAMGELQAGDMILCRVNAPLVQPAFDLIRRGIKAIIKGRDIGSGLSSLIKRMHSDGTIFSLMDKLSEYRNLETEKLSRSEKWSQLALLNDKVDTIIALSDGCQTVDEVTTRIQTVFSDDNAAITFSSVHKAKGLEAERVYILKPELMPHPLAKQPWMQAAERNIEYVATTRSLDRLCFVNGG